MNWNFHYTFNKDYMPTTQLAAIICANIVCSMVARVVPWIAAAWLMKPVFDAISKGVAS